jgi:6-phospho-3-hexuloisomerase
MNGDPRDSTKGRRHLLEEFMGIQVETVRQALSELEAVLTSMDEDAVDLVSSEVQSAKRVVVYGLGRELLSLRAFAMRLMHLGIDAHVAGDVTAKPVGLSDLVIISAGPGTLPMAETMANLAREAGSRILVLTAQPRGHVPRKADRVIKIPAQTMADDVGSASIFPMGTAFEIAMLIFLDLVAIRLRESTGQSISELRDRHFNLE